MLVLLYRYAAHAVYNYSVPWQRTAYADACHGLSSHRPYGPFLALDGYKSATNRHFATTSFLTTTVCKLSDFENPATPSIIGCDSYTAPRTITDVLSDIISFIACSSGHTSAVLRCTRLLSNLRPADANAGWGVVCMGCLCGGGCMRTPVRDGVWNAWDARAVADACGRPCRMGCEMRGMSVRERMPADAHAG